MFGSFLLKEKKRKNETTLRILLKSSKAGITKPSQGVYSSFEDHIKQKEVLLKREKVTKKGVKKRQYWPIRIV